MPCCRAALVSNAAACGLKASDLLPTLSAVPMAVMTAIATWTIACKRRDVSVVSNRTKWQQVLEAVILEQAHDGSTSLVAAAAQRLLLTVLAVPQWLQCVSLDSRTGRTLLHTLTRMHTSGMQHSPLAHIRKLHAADILSAAIPCIPCESCHRSQTAISSSGSTTVDCSSVAAMRLRIGCICALIHDCPVLATTAITATATTALASNSENNSAATPSASGNAVAARSVLKTLQLNDTSRRSSSSTNSSKAIKAAHNSFSTDSVSSVQPQATAAS
eukprot:923-Heterococcus_DN1.PRE.1